MKKMRMSIDDIHAMVGSIRANVVNMRVTNIYDIQVESESGAAKTYILKLHQPPFPKVFLLLESGVRFHTSKYARDAKAGSALPSQFTMKLRKHLRGKRLSALTQLEGDRVVDFTFGQGYEIFFSSNSKEEKNAYCPLSDAHDKCQLASYSVSTCVAFQQMISLTMFGPGSV
ncbi:Predicted RNA-binding protein [Plasmopara halstedii]|uniref:Predicted RNA-binding protein n=1 Tax=Plasmopara halstedii TaxID=4781 RepID=A0A0P1AT93_PLAHL|nr:Predicted RNA-binding protein [Plasmopara halstedii]CEG44462.1 Predicted RNA-binding protein [Plasmopara halstedii]|eukprot:XP_024580831.1 Predicted RNA-binding protein [Plasmopara halstedii]